MNDMETCFCARKVTRKECRISRRRFEVRTITRMENGLKLLIWLCPVVRSGKFIKPDYTQIYYIVYLNPIQVLFPAR